LTHHHQVTVKNVAGEAPNGSAFAITVGPAPELDATNLVVGRVIGGMDDVVATLAALPRAKPRDEW
jgi:peptidyl-prolyl cis-trans isomerase B (cyclophilin B)